MDLNEQKFRMLSEYAFINDKSYKSGDELDSALLEDDDPLDGFDLDDSDEGDESNPEDMETPEGDEEIDPAVEPQPGEEPADEQDDEFPADEIEGDTNDVETDEDGDIELDVSDLVKGNEETKETAEITSQKIDTLLQSIDTLIQSSSKIDALASRMDNIEQEIIKRNPTKDEKLEMQSLHSAPYNIKIGDYWADKPGYVSDISDPNSQPTFNDIDEPKEYVLDPNEIENSYNETNVKNTFDYDEEEVDDYSA